MGMFSFVKKQMSSVIEWRDQNPELLFHKMETATDEVKNASKLIVAPGQGCLLVYDGKVQDVLTEEGVYFLESDNHPFITTLLKLRQNFESEHKMRLYFFRTAQILNVEWGTPNPVKYMEPEYKFPVQLGACGNFSARIAKPEEIFKNFLGSTDDYTAEMLKELVTSRLTTILTSFLAKAAYSYKTIDSHLADMSSVIQPELKSELEQLGFELTDFRIGSVTFDEATQERIGKVANLTTEALSAAEVGLSYTDLEKLRALRDAAKTEGNLAGAGLQVGAGLELSRSLLQQEADKKKDEVLAASAANDDPIMQLKKLKLMLDEQLITQAEYDTKKEEVLKRI